MAISPLLSRVINLMMNFIQPELLWLLLLVPCFAWRLSLRQQQQHNIHYSSTELLKNLPRSFRQRFLWLVPFLYLIALTATIVTVAQPYKNSRSFTEQAEGIAISIVLDISTSMQFGMQIDKKKQPRLEVAKKVIKQFVIGDGEQLKGRPNDLISVITFARYADTLVPLTSSHDALVAMTQDITTTTRPNEDSTAFGDATALAAAQLSHYEQTMGLNENSIKSKIMILLTDGENNSGDYQPLMAAAMAKDWGVKIYTISLGDPSNNWPNNSDELNAEQAMSNTDWILQKMAQSTGGIFQRAHDYQSLQNVYQVNNRLETSTLQQISFEKISPAYKIPCLIALCCLLLASLLNATWLRVNS